MISINKHALSLTLIIALFTSCDSISPSITKEAEMKIENQPNRKSIPGDQSGYPILADTQARRSVVNLQPKFVKNTDGSKTVITSKEKAIMENFTGKQNTNLADVPLHHQGRSYQQTASDKIYEDDTVKRRQVYGTEKIVTEKTFILPGEKGIWYAVQTNENHLVASLYKEKGKDLGGRTKSRNHVPGNTLPIVEVVILQAGLNVVNSDKGLAMASLRLIEINQQGDSSCLRENSSLPDEFQAATPGHAAMIKSSTVPNALYTGELNIEIVRADIWAVQQKISSARNESQNSSSNLGNAIPPNSLSATELQQANELLRTILNDYDLPETKAVWQKICADVKRGKEHYIVNITGQISTPAK